MKKETIRAKKKKRSVSHTSKMTWYRHAVIFFGVGASLAAYGYWLHTRPAGVTTRLAVYSQKMRGWVTENSQQVNQKWTTTKAAVHSIETEPEVHFEFYTALSNASPPVATHPNAAKPTVATGKQLALLNADQLQRDLETELQSKQTNKVRVKK